MSATTRTTLATTSKAGAGAGEIRLDYKPALTGSYQLLGSVDRRSALAGAKARNLVLHPCTNILVRLLIFRRPPHVDLDRCGHQQ